MPDFYVRTGPATLVNSTADGDQTEPVIAVLGNGSYVVVWTDASGSDPAASDIKAQLFGSAGQKIGGEISVATATAGAQASPSVAALADGRFVVTWSDESGWLDLSGESPDNSGTGVKAQIFDAAGAKIGGEFLVNSFTGSFQSQPVVVGLAGGGFVVSWTDASLEGGDDDGTSIKAQLYDAGGIRIGGEFLVNTAVETNQTLPTIAALPTGGFAIAWTGFDTSFETPAIFMQSFDAAGAAVGGEQRVNADTTDIQGSPSIAATGSGFVVVWKVYAESFDNEVVKAQLFNLAGEKSGGELILTSPADTPVLQPSVQGLSGGGFLVAWAQPGASSSLGDIRAQSFDALGRPLGGRLGIHADAAGSQQTPRMAELASGEIVVVYSNSGGSGGDPFGYAVSQQRLTTSDTLTGTNQDDALNGGPGNNQINGGEGNDKLVGRDGDDVLDGGGGADRLEGGKGNDIFVVDNPGDQVVEAVGEGNDIVRSSVDFVLPDHVEQVVLTGSAAINATGNGLANTLVGNGAANRLDGGSGADTMRGGGGNDVYIVDNAGDRVTELSGQGVDTVRSSVSYTLGNHVENLALTDAGLINGTGNGLANVITGNAKANILDGGAGADTLRGGKGHDTYIVDNAGDTVIELAGEGTDTIRAYVSYSLPDHVEALGLGGAGIIDGTGNALDNRIYGNAKANVIDGGAGADTMWGRGGHDTYIVDNVNDRVVEGVDEGIDTVKSSVSYGLIPNIENLYLTGTAAINGTGNAAANRLVGNSAANTLDGARGADRMEGRLGNDTYIVDHAYDTVIELANEGIDRVRSLVSFTLPEHVEILVLEGSAAINATGNALTNQLVGNRANNVLDGGAGMDWMWGGFGNDTYVVDHVDDQVTEFANEGVDRVKSSISYRLGENVENLYLTGREAIDGEGNELANKIVGNKGANVLAGRGGADIMQGGLGNDVYIVEDSGDRVIEAQGEGVDTVKSAVSFSLAGQDLENLTLTGWNPINGTGNALANKIIGNEAANVLNGGGGEDLLRGGAGGDSFQFTAALGSSKVAHIEDFSPIEDRIVLGGNAGQAFAALASGALGSHAFRSGSTAADADDRILYDRSTGTLYYDADGAGGAAAVKFATVAPYLDLSAADFLVSGPANNAPIFTSGTTATIAENSDASTIVYQARATDADGDSISYALSGADAALFTIDAAGAVRLRAPADYETRTSYSLTVEARDSGATASSHNVTINVTDVSEATPTPRLYEISDWNDYSGVAQNIHRDFLERSTNPNLANDDLPSVIILGSIATPDDADFFSIDLEKGELLILDVDFSGGNLDALIKVYSATITGALAENDDLGSFDPGSDPHPQYGHNTDPFLRFRAPHAGTYHFSIEAFSGGSDRTSGSYQLNVSVGPPATPAELLEEDIQAMLSGYRWSASRLTYGFATNASHYASGEWSEEIAAGMAGLNIDQQGAVRTALGQIANFTNLSFGQAANPGTADLRFALSDLPETAYAIYPGPGMGGDSWYNSTDYSSPKVGNYEWVSFLHETGHALGLKHPHEIPSVSAGRDLHSYTVMSYRSYTGAPIDETGGYTNETWGYPQTYMMLDIAALQRLYGADFSYNSGNTTYSWSQSTGAFMINGQVQWTPGANRIFMTVWDGGGTDTYDFSNYSTSLEIDLRPGMWTKTSDVQLANLGDGRIAIGNIANALLYENDPRSLIENAIGGSGSDGLIANAARNRLTGGGGADWFAFYSVEDSRPGAADTITDFVRGTDKILLTDIDAIPGTVGDDAFRFVGTDAFSRRAGELRYEARSDGVHLFGDVNGDGVADLEIIVANQTSLSLNDFLF